MKTIILDGHKFTKTQDRKYYYNSTLRKHLHQYVYEKEYGKVKKGNEVHHKDFNTENNDISNLEEITSLDHHEIHKNNMSEDVKKKLRKNMIENVVPKAVAWHKSEEGKKWHKKNYERNKEVLRRKISTICECCGKEYTATDNGNGKFCSNKCKSKNRRDKKLDDVIKKCIVCGNEFSSNKYYNTQTCCGSCSAILGHHKDDFAS